LTSATICCPTAFVVSTRFGECILSNQILTHGLAGAEVHVSTALAVGAWPTNNAKITSKVSVANRTDFCLDFILK